MVEGGVSGAAGAGRAGRAKAPKFTYSPKTDVHVTVHTKAGSIIMRSPKGQSIIAGDWRKGGKLPIRYTDGTGKTFRATVDAKELANACGLKKAPKKPAKAAALKISAALKRPASFRSFTQLQGFLRGYVKPSTIETNLTGIARNETYPPGKSTRYNIKFKTNPRTGQLSFDVTGGTAKGRRNIKFMLSLAPKVTLPLPQPGKAASQGTIPFVFPGRRSY